MWRRRRCASSIWKGEPRWEYKFIRRAIEDDPSIELVTHPAHDAEQDLPAGYAWIRTNWKTDFPTKAEELFKYDGLIIGSVEANYFSNEQQAIDSGFCGQARRRRAVSGRPVCARAMAPMRRRRWRR